MSRIFLFTLFLLSILTPEIFGVTSYNVNEVYQFPNATWVENIVVRPNGNLLVTLVNTPQIWQIDPSKSPKSSRASFVHQFSDAEMATGITELSADVYGIIASNTIWKLDLSNRDGTHTIQMIQKIDGGSLNGMAVLNRSEELVAIADCQLGLVWRLDMKSGDYSVMLKDDSMASNTDIGPLLGINGLKVLDDYVYYVNTPRRLYCRVHVDTFSGQAIGPYEVISTGAMADDFAIDILGVAYLAGLTDNVITKVLPDGTQEIIAGSRNSSLLMTATSAAIGRSWNSNVLFITTGGNTKNVTNYTGRGKIMALSLCS